MMNFEDLFKNPQWSLRLPKDTQESVRRAIPAASAKIPSVALDHLWVMSSGTESQRGSRVKVVALSRDALLTAARGVSEVFALNSQDVYLNPLPYYHIAGAAVLARQHVAQFKLISFFEKWNAQKFIDVIHREGVTCTSVVPTQIYDLVQEQIHAPRFLRVVFVGAGHVSEDLFQKAKALGWPLVLTYGMTETCAMLAFKRDVAEGYSRFPHIVDWASRKVDDKFRLAFSSRSLLSGFLFVNGTEWEFTDPKENGWYISDDLGEIKQDQLWLTGRSSELVKILGETVAIGDIQQQWSRFHQSVETPSSHEYLVVAVPEVRKGHELVMVTTDGQVGSRLSQFNQQLLPFSRLQRWYHVDQIPRSPLGKILRGDLVDSLSRRPSLPII
ncbi:MAG: AMP-binding protein [Bdellovibrionales bacterium]|nr:AMP-binding protein [Bdellovibrionales bacterium]